VSGAVAVDTSVRTWGDLIADARTLLQDKTPTSGSRLRYSDAEMFEAINRMLIEVRMRRPDFFINAFGRRSLRRVLPFYSAARDMRTPFPLDLICYPAFVHYLVGSAEMREDTFADSGRAQASLASAMLALSTVTPPPSAPARG